MTTLHSTRARSTEPTHTHDTTNIFWERFTACRAGGRGMEWNGMECLCLSDGVTLQHVMRWGELRFIRCTGWFRLQAHSHTDAWCTPLRDFNIISTHFGHHNTFFFFWTSLLELLCFSQPIFSTVRRTRTHTLHTDPQYCNHVDDKATPSSAAPLPSRHYSHLHWPHPNAR